MNCALIQSTLLSSESPNSPEPELLPHLKKCSNCRAFQIRLSQLEVDLKALTSPVNAAPAAFLSVFRREPKRVVSRQRYQLGLRTQSQETGRRKLALTVALAASLLIFSLGWGILSYGPTLSSQPPQVRQNQETQAIAAIALHVQARQQALELPSVDQRALALATLAEQIVGATRTAISNRDIAHVRALAQFYCRLVHEDLVGQVEILSQHRNERQLIAELADRCTRVESELSRILADNTTPAPARKSLQAMVRTAQATDQHFRWLLRRV